MSTSRDNRLRRPVILGCLTAAVLLIGMLGWEAIAAARAQRQAAEDVLHDYAELAAEQYARNVGVVLDYEWFFPGLRLAGPVLAGEVPLDVDSELEGQRNRYPLSRSIESFFRVATEGDLVDVPLVPVPSGSATRPIYSPESLGDQIRSHADSHGGEDWPYAAFPLPGSGASPRMAVYRPLGDLESPAALYGFITADGSLDAHLAGAVDIYDLLPETLTDGNNDLVHVSVLDARGQELFAFGPQGAGPESAPFALPAHLGGLQVVATIPDASAADLVTGGLPYSRLPAIIATIAVALMLLGISALLWRRERELMQLREEFVAGASHELRTPLAQIRMFAETLRLDRVRTDDEARRSVEIIDREARRLSLLVENLLQFSGSDGRTRQFAPEALSVRALAEDVAEGFAPLAAARGTTIVVDGDAGAHANADRDMLKQVLVNLLDNAVKYGPEGQTVHIDIAREGADVLLSVRDQGPGIPEADRQRVFERFWRGPRTDAVTGTGIGLALVKELVELHGGTVSVAQKTNGARFTVRLPGADS